MSPSSISSSSSFASSASHLPQARKRSLKKKGSDASLSQVRNYMLKNLYDEVPPARMGATSRRQSGTNSPTVANRPPQFMPIKRAKTSRWTSFSRIVTFCYCPSCLTFCGKKDPLMQQAWREKMALCLIIFLMSCALISYTVGIGMVICKGTLPSSSAYFMADNSNVPVWREDVTIFGLTYSYQEASRVLRDHGVDLTSDWQGRDISRLFERTSGCDKYPVEKDVTCIITNPYFLSPPLFAAPNAACLSRYILTSLPQTGSVYFTWSDLKGHGAPPHSLIAFSGRILNLTEYFQNDSAHSFLVGIPGAEAAIKNGLGKDVTIPFVNSEEYKGAMQCLLNRYTVGSVGTETVGCTFKNIVMALIITVIWCVILIKLIMAIMYLCISSEALTQRPIDEKGSAGGVVHHKIMDNRLIVLVTCYSEGEKGLRRTLNSIADTDYPDNKKLIFIVSDGLITGSGNNQSTPDILIRMISLDPNLEVSPKSYIAISEGSHQHNMAAVYAGTYRNGDRVVPVVLVVKCGTFEEQRHGKKPGNRGKRDSQMILMNLLSRVMFNDRMTPLDYDIFYKVKCITGGRTIDKYDFVLMVDADTVMEMDSVKYMVRAMNNDPSIMGLCGETKIANKISSWVTMIQVFEYFISHHLNKSFESVFGGVSCLPGCFCLYRIKFKTAGDKYIPVLVNPDIVEEYSENSVQTLHEKNLLLLGEDRFLTTLLLRQFPKRRMIFLPQAICHTDVPESFAVLLSQRRRWINSTVHNLWELMKVKELCGVFCFSMQFVIVLDLIGTLLLPAAVILLGYFIASTILWGSFDPIAVGMVIGAMALPGVVMIFATGNLPYLAWMAIYIIAIPIWNFLLPIYAFSKFDDFTWGETRKVVGDLPSSRDHLARGSFLIGSVPLKRWADWELERRGAPPSHPPSRAHIRIDQVSGQVIDIAMGGSDPSSSVSTNSSPAATPAGRQEIRRSEALRPEPIRALRQVNQLDQSLRGPRNLNLKKGYSDLKSPSTQLPPSQAGQGASSVSINDGVAIPSSLATSGRLYIKRDISRQQPFGPRPLPR